MDAKQKAYLKTIYYEDRLYREVKRDGRYNIKRKDLKNWLTSQETYGLHRQARRSFKRPRVMVSGIGKQADADLMDMTQLSKYNDGVRFVLLHIDDFSRFIRTVTLKSKTGN